MLFITKSIKEYDSCVKFSFPTRFRGSAPLVIHSSSQDNARFVSVTMINISLPV